MEAFRQAVQSDYAEAFCPDLMIIFTNFDNFPSRWQTKEGVTGETRILRSASAIAKAARRAPKSIALINCNPPMVYGLAARSLTAPGGRPALVAVDLVLRRPRSVRSWLLHPFRRFLLSRVDHFFHYFKDLRGYDSIFGVGPDRSSFVPFKANLFERVDFQNVPPGEYVLCLGRTLRDYDTFFEAIEKLPLPAAIARPDRHLMKRHGARFSRPLDRLPKNVRILEDDGSPEAMAEIIRSAKIVVIPILPESMAASGCSTCLNAMLFKKCIIGTEGPGFSDVFENHEVLCVPPKDPVSLAQAIQDLWENDDRRESMAARGFEYAVSAGGEQDLFQRLIDRVIPWFQNEYLRLTSRKAPNAERN